MDKLVDYPVVWLRDKADRRLRAGHSWIYSNEIDTGKSPLRDFEPGQPVNVFSPQDKFLGVGYINPNSLICIRLLTRQPGVALDRSLLVHRLNIALGLRQRFYDRPFYRLVFGESDGLPGLIVDRYGDYCVVAIATAGMEALLDEVIAALHKVLKPAGILLRNDSNARSQEDLSRYVEIAAGKVPERVRIVEGSCEFDVPVLEGQKTGWFYDQAANRQRLLKYINGGEVLDVCSYIGAWSVQAATAGADTVTSIDVSADALGWLDENAQLNNCADKLTTMRADAFDAMRELKQEKRRFDVIILDPPAFIKKRKDLKKGQAAYRRLNELAIRLLKNDGILVSASCSYHLSDADLMQLIQQAARHNDRWVQVLEEGRQGLDHPVSPAIIETAYLKAFYCRVLGNMG